jgi:phage terminase large subunit
VVCIREVQNTIKDSVKQLLIDKITKFGLHEHFECLETEIRGPNGSFVVFKGMQAYNAMNIKSLEGFDICWVEEAQTLSQNSLDLLLPTIRKDNSEIWFSWNPQYKTDPVDKFFRKYPPPDAISVLVNWPDNPWFPTVLRRQMEHDFTVDEDKAEHIWNGAYGVSQGSILGKWVSRAIRESRISPNVRYDQAGSPVIISSDLGFRDTASWWYWQPCVGGYRLIKYQGASGWDADDWIPEIQKTLNELGIERLGKIWLPHDARAKTFQSKHSSVEKFIAAFGVTKLGVVAQSKKADQISAARTVIDKCEFHVDLCEDGIDGLAAWEFEYNEENQVFSREPLHNWASHPSDAFAYGCQVMQMEVAPVKEEDKPIRGLTIGQNTVTLDELYATSPVIEERY